jgi:hypothetical protein
MSHLLLSTAAPLLTPALSSLNAGYAKIFVSKSSMSTSTPLLVRDMTGEDALEELAALLSAV